MNGNNSQTGQKTVEQRAKHLYERLAEYENVPEDEIEVSVGDSETAFVTAPEDARGSVYSALLAEGHHCRRTTRNGAYTVSM